MVTRTETNKLPDTLTAKVDSVELEAGIDDQRQYHFSLTPVGFKVNGPTKQLHEWINLSKTASEEAIPQGGVADRFLTQVEIVVPGASKAKTVGEAFKLMVGKTFIFKRLKLGRDFNGKPAREYLVPIQLA